MTDKNIGCLVAENHGKVCGILPDRDRAEGDREDKEPLATMVEEMMTRDPVRISVSRNIRDLVSLMHSPHVRRVPIVDGSDATLGMVTMDDLIASSAMKCLSLVKRSPQGFASRLGKRIINMDRSQPDDDKITPPESELVVSR
jgi:signal-transduction protein with cAMP-binding, CBS, and nucleotidyltransferase domain